MNGSAGVGIGTRAGCGAGHPPRWPGESLTNQAGPGPTTRIPLTRGPVHSDYRLKAVTLYLDFLFNEWGVKTLVGKTLVRNVRGVGAMRKLGAKVVEESARNGQPEYIWTLERRRSA